MAEIKIILDKCLGCRLCIKACPYNAIKVEDKKAYILENCILCGACLGSCKFKAIELLKDGDTEIKTDVSIYNGVWIYAEQKNGVVSSTAFELLGVGRKLADKLKVELSAVLIGSSVEAQVNILAAYGADNVYIVDHSSLVQFNDESYSEILVQLINNYRPEIVLISATTYGRSLAPRVSSRIDTGLTADCTSLDIDLEKRILMQTRPAFGGNLMATIICPDRRPQMSTVRPKVMKPLEPDQNRKAVAIKPEVDIPDSTSIKVLEIINDLSEKVNLAEADIIVSAGRGIGDPANIKMIQELAGLLGAAVGASRAVVDAGWISYNHQVGQTGKTVSPKVYIACGISGAVQHLAGMSSSDTIIAINRNPEAPIFKLANYGIVGDVLEVIPAMIKELKKRL